MSAIGPRPLAATMRGISGLTPAALRLEKPIVGCTNVEIFAGLIRGSRQPGELDSPASGTCRPKLDDHPVLSPRTWALLVANLRTQRRVEPSDRSNVDCPITRLSHTIQEQVHRRNRERWPDRYHPPPVFNRERPLVLDLAPALSACATFGVRADG